MHSSRLFPVAIVAACAWMAHGAAAAADAHAGPVQPTTGNHEMHAMHDEHMAMMREAKDRQDIEELMWRYARALDSLDANAYAATYTEDGQFIAGESTTKGREALKNMVQDIRKVVDERAAKGQKPPGTLHMVTNHMVWFPDKDHAIYHSYWMTMMAAKGTEYPPLVAEVGRGVDELVRVNGKWLIKVRNVSPQN